MSQAPAQSVAPSSTAPKAEDKPSILEVVQRYWGFQELRPLQAEAIEAALAGRDSLVVLPTGGGKSLCYQVPPIISGTTDIVISPLISLMKDQVDGLRECGYPAAAIYSGIDGSRRREIEQQLRGGKYRLLFVAPERAVTPWFFDLAARLNIRRLAIDEAHCISHWGHDFRPEYRRLAELRERFPQASFHAFTATATPRVRDDIVKQLGLRDPAVLVGSFDRSNLIYRVIPTVDVYAQSIEVIRRHASEAVIVYCISRKDTESLAEVLRANHIQAEAYHAGMDSTERHRVQDAFANEQLNVVVATVAFGMGIDRSNVRCVLHTAMPKTIEHYQQESGRAGRDGLEAECVLLYSYADMARWESLVLKNEDGKPEKSPEIVEAQLELLKQMQRFCNSFQCRHLALVAYFGQTLETVNCGACDVCLNDSEAVEDGTITAQKILSCVARTEERFGVGHVVEVLIGSDTDMIRRCRHNELSTYGLLRDLSKKHVQSLVYQLVDQTLLDRTPGERPILQLNEASWEVLRGKRQVKFARPKKEAPAKAAIEQESWEGVDRGLFDRLRGWRRLLAEKRGVPPYVVMHDSTLRSLAQIRPTTEPALAGVPGMGERRKADYGLELLEIIRSHCAEHKLTTNHTEQTSHTSYVKPARRSKAKRQAFELFAKRWSLDDVKHSINRARSTVIQYLVEFIAADRPRDIDCWIDRATYRAVAETAKNAEERRLTPVFEQLDGRVSFDEIRLVLAHIEALGAAHSPK